MATQIPINTDAMMLNWARGTQEKVWGHDRSQWVSASSIGSCMRKQKLDLAEKTRTLAETPDEKIMGMGRMFRGNVMEDYAISRAARLIFKGRLKHSSQRNQVSFKDDMNGISATTDALLPKITKKDCENFEIPPKYLGQCAVIEFKSANPMAMDSYRRGVSAKYEAQVMTQIIGVNADDEYDYEPTIGLIFFVNADDYMDSIGYLIEPGRHDLKMLVARAKRIMSAAIPEDLPAEGPSLKGGCAGQYCAHTGEGTRKCKKGIFVNSWAAMKVEDSEVEQMFRTYVETNDKVKAAEKELKKVKLDILEQLSAREAMFSGMACGGITARNQKRTTTRRDNKGIDGFLRDNGKNPDDFKTTTTGSVLYVKRDK